MQTEETWPIKVGGIYLFKADRPEVRSRVNSVHDGKVYWIHVYVANDRKLPVGEEFGHCIDSEWLFRAMHRPEDASPIPQLIAALQGISAGVLSRDKLSDNEERMNLNVSLDAWKAVEAALEAAR